jgi:membrane peptidoglycan carboxypeptidase
MSRRTTLKKPRAIFNRRFLKNALIVVAAAALLTTGSLAIWVSTLEIPSLSSFDKRDVAQSTKIYDKSDDVLLYDVFQDVRRTIVPLDKISDHMKHATLAIEDPDFYSHSGVKPSAVLRATWVNLKHGSFVQGGSTITQQVVKNSVLTPEKTLTRKLKEWLLAVKLEQLKSKKEILSIYLNETPYGGNVYGVEEAAQAYFSKPARDLSIAESAYMAALPKAPTYYLNNPDLLEARKNQVLLELRSHNYITPQEYRNAKDEEINLTIQEGEGIKAPHFVMHVKEQLIERFGEAMVQRGGLTVKTTLDYDMQKRAQRIVQEGAERNAQRFNARNAAMVALDPTSGGVRVMVGSRNYFSNKINGQFNVATAHRQPGSTFKPFAYATALRKGYTPDTTVFDLHTQFNSSCSPANTTGTGNCYAPVNYDGKFRGPVTFREALAQSINVPSIKVLYLAGMDATLQLARSMGIEGLGTIGQYGLTLVLGGGEVSLLDLSNAYGVFANNGLKNDHYSIIEVKITTERSSTATPTTSPGYYPNKPLSRFQIFCLTTLPEHRRLAKTRPSISPIMT